MATAQTAGRLKGRRSITPEGYRSIEFMRVVKEASLRRVLARLAESVGYDADTALWLLGENTDEMGDAYYAEQDFYFGFQVDYIGDGRVRIYLYGEDYAEYLAHG